MIDIAGKKPTLRIAAVEAKVLIKPDVLRLVKKGKVPKGDCLEAARLAGILAAKKTPFLIPLCHPIAVEHISIDFALGKGVIEITAKVKGRAKTGVEMEAFSAAAAASLTIYDMCKALDREMVISDIRLIRKSGGESGDYVRKSNIKYKKSKIKK